MKNSSFCFPVVLLSLTLIFSLFPSFKAFPNSSKKIDHLIRLKESEKQRLTNEQKETLVQINITEKRTTRVLEALKVLEENINYSLNKLKRLKQSLFLSKKQIIETGSKIKDLEAKIEKDKEEINQHLLALFYLGQTKKMTLFIGLNSFEHYFRNQKLLQNSTRLDVELLDRVVQNLAQYREENEKLDIQLKDLNSLQREEEALKKLLGFERQQQVTYLDHLRSDRSAHIRYLRDIQVELEQLNDKLYKLTATKENQKRTDLFNGFRKKENGLQSPVSGKIIHHFGQRESDFFTLYRRGVVVETAADESVHSILAGKVVWAGPFRGYQNLVILDHGKGSFSVYGNLGELFVLVNDVIDRGYVLGGVAYDKVEKRSLFYFEMRYNKKAVNPSRWLRKPQWKK